MSDNEKRPISLKLALFLDDQVARLSSFGLRFESFLYSINKIWDLETIGDFFSRRSYSIGSVVSGIMFPFLICLLWTFRQIGNVANGLAEQPLVKPIVLLLSFVFGRLMIGNCQSLWCFLNEYLRTRNPILWPLSSFAILLIASITTAGVLTIQSSGSGIDKSYRKAIRHELALGNFDRVQLYQAKLAQLEIPFGQAEMRAVNQLYEQGKVTEAIRMAQQLAPVDRAGLAAAHLFLVLASLRDENDIPSKPALQMAEAHLEHLSFIHERMFDAKGQLPPELTFLKGLLKLKQNQTEEASRIFRELSPNYWAAAAASLDINTKLGRKIESRNAAGQLLRWSRLEPSILSQLTHDCYSQWYRIEKQTHEPNSSKMESREAKRFIAENWQRHFPADGMAAEACLVEFGDAIEAWSSSGQTEKRRAAKTLTELAEILGVKHRDRLATWLIPKLGHSRTPTRMDAVLQLAEESNPNPVLLEIMGTRAIDQGDHARAIDLLRKSVELDPKNAIAWNNLAVVSKRIQSQPLEQAFEAANSAVQLQPNNEAMRLTRGMIAYEMQKWDLACDDLEWVLRSQPDNREIHLYLANIYQRLGKSDQSSLHRLLAGK